MPACEWCGKDFKTTRAQSDRFCTARHEREFHFAQESKVRRAVEIAEQAAEAA